MFSYGNVLIKKSRKMKEKNNIKRCDCCGFILGTRPNCKDKDGVCQACINVEESKKFDWKQREADLKEVCEVSKLRKGSYDCVVAVSGGKDSTVITQALVEKYGLKPLLVTVRDEFRTSQAGKHNIENLAKRFNLDHIVWRCEPNTFCTETLKDFEKDGHLLKWIEEKIYNIPIMIAKKFGIRDVWFGENSAFQYGTSDKLDYLCPLSDEETKVYYFFAFTPYSEIGNRDNAKKYGFKDLEDFKEWYRQGQIERYTQQDSYAYIVHLWLKFLKFGFQRVSDIACRYVRAGILTKEQAEQLIKDHDWRLDKEAKEDLCKTINISEEYFDSVCDKIANKDLLVKDVNGNWRRKDLL